MKKLLAALVVGAFAFASISALAQEKTAPEPVDQAKLKAERDAAKAELSKKIAELYNKEVVGVYFTQFVMQ